MRSTTAAAPPSPAQVHSHYNYTCMCNALMDIGCGLWCGGRSEDCRGASVGEGEGETNRKNQKAPNNLLFIITLDYYSAAQRQPAIIPVAYTHRLRMCSLPWPRINLCDRKGRLESSRGRAKEHNKSKSSVIRETLLVLCRYYVPSL